jgi:H+/Cl- antiporter ClcA
MALVSVLAVPVGLAAGVAAWALLRLIGLLSNLVFYHRLAFDIHTPDGTQPWWVTVLAPVVGGVAVGLLARFACPQVRGHGLPEAIEALLVGRARIPARVAVLKPLASGIAIGTGGPFGAEGPIIMTGGALGSLVGQMHALTVNERRTLLVSGSAAGMAAALDAPLASIVFAAELLLFEWRPQSLIPVAAAVCVATMLRTPLLGHHHEFFMPVPTANPADGLAMSLLLIVLCLASGAVSALAAIALTVMVRIAEDGFSRLRVHWMLWPAIGGAVVGAGGLVAPRATGVGYDVIAAQLNGSVSLQLTVSILVVKAVIWPIALGSGTSGGILAPAFVLGTCLGGVEAAVLPEADPGFWALLALAGLLNGLLRSPLTGIVFALEITGRWDAVVPVTIAAMAACALSVLALKRSMLTDKVARGGLHLSREYTVDPLAAMVASQVMHATPIRLMGHQRASDVREALCCTEGCTNHPVGHPHRLAHAQRLFPVLAEDGDLIGVVTRSAIARAGDQGATLASLVIGSLTVAYEDTTLSQVAELMAVHRVTALPVLHVGSVGQPSAGHLHTCRSSDDPVWATQVAGVITLRQLLAPREQKGLEEATRERLLTPVWLSSRRSSGPRRADRA